MDGFTAAGILRKKGLKIPIIALTANAMKGFEAQCIEAGYSGYLSKPINIDQFMELLAQLLGGRKVKKDAKPNPVSEISQEVKQKKNPAADSSPIVSKLPVHMDKFRDIVVRFVKRLGQQLDAIEKAASRGDLKEVAELAHWLKGAGGTVGFDVFTDPAAQLEIHAKKGNSTQINSSIANLKQLARRLVVPGEETAVASPLETKPSKEVQLSESLSPNMPTASVTKPVVSRLAKMTRLQPAILSFVQKLDEKVESMEAALEQADMTELAGLAHWLKGAGGTVGYDAFTKPAQDLETSAKAAQAETAHQALQAVRSLAAAIVPPDVNSEST
jgi:HPt (histidine-containing phosphotransfer) domain-containing protein